MRITAGALFPVLACLVFLVFYGLPSLLSGGELGRSVDDVRHEFVVSIIVGLRAFSRSWIEYRDDVQMLSDVSQKIRSERITSYLGFGLFVLLVAPRNIQNIRAFFNQMMKKHPLPAFNKGGINDENIMQARKVLFFFCLFLIYQIVQFPLTNGHESELAFVSDFAFQFVIITFLISEYRGLKRALEERWRNDPSRSAYMQDWLNSKLDGMNVKWRNIRKLAVGVLMVGFGPAFGAHLYGWMDSLAGLSDQVASMMSTG